MKALVWTILLEGPDSTATPEQIEKYGNELMNAVPDLKSKGANIFFEAKAEQILSVEMIDVLPEGPAGAF